MSHLSLCFTQRTGQHYRQLNDGILQKSAKYQEVPQRVLFLLRLCALQPHIHAGQLVLQRLPLKLRCFKGPPSKLLVHQRQQSWPLFFPTLPVLKPDSFVGCRCFGKCPSCLRTLVSEIRACGHFSQTKHRMIQLPRYGSLSWLQYFIILFQRLQIHQ